VNPRTRGALLWGLVGALAFLVLAQGYGLVTADRITLPAMAGVALVVGGVAAGATYALAGAKGINGGSR
jgi:hypothetical protein